MISKRVLITAAIIAAMLATVFWWILSAHIDKGAKEEVPTLKVAALFPMTGPGASLGEYLHNGVTLAKEELDRKYEGRLKIDIEILDSKNQPREAISALRALIARDRPHAVISGLSSVSSAIKPVVESEGITTVATATALEDLLGGAKHIIRVYPTSMNFVSPVIDYIAGRYKRVAIVYIHDDFGASNHDVFRRLAIERGIAVVAAEPYELLQPETRSLVAKVAGARPQAVYVVGYGPAYTRLFTQFKEQAPELQLLADIALPNPAVLSALGDAAEGIVFNGTAAELTEPDSEAAATFRKRYKERFGKEPFMVAGFAYDALMMLTDATLLTNETMTAPTKQSLIALSPFKGIMGDIALNERGENDIPLRLMIRRDGRTIPYTATSPTDTVK